MEKKIRQVYAPGSGQIIEKKSRFIGESFPISSEEEAQSLINAVRKKYYDARHHCFAYVMGDENAARFSDDGEPQGTAGKPILEVLTGEGLVNSLVVVTRYFGGTLLGTGGLTRAYREACKAALDNTELIERHRGIRFKVTLDYSSSGGLDNFLRRQQDLYEVDTVYSENVTKTFVVPVSSGESVKKGIVDLSSDKAQIEMSDELEYGIVNDRVIWL